MKKIVCFLLMSMILLLTACAERTSTVEAGVPVNAAEASASTEKSVNPIDTTQNQNSSGSQITINTPMTVSDNLIPYGETTAYLRLKMISGRYYEDWNPGAYMGPIWEGRFILELSDNYGKTLTQTDLSQYFPEPLTFTRFFKLEFDDYNNDGNMDFTLGQYASSNGGIYKLFTLKPDGRVEELVVKDKPEIFISDSPKNYSIKLHKFNNTAFKSRYYDNSQGKNYESIYDWQEGMFVNILSREIMRLEGYYEMMSDTSLKPKDMLAYMKKNINHSIESDAANLALQLESLQKDYMNQLANRFYNQDFIKSEFEKLYKKNTMLTDFDDIKDITLKELLIDIRDNGYKLISIEGGQDIIIDYSIYNDFNLYLPEDLASYFTIMAAESDQVPAMDAALVIKWEEVVRRALAQEQFLLLHYKSQKWIEMQALYKRYISFVFLGLPNTPGYTFGTKIINPELKKSLMKVAEGKYNTQLEKAISGYLKVLSKNKYTFTKEVEQFRENAAAALIKQI